MLIETDSTELKVTSLHDEKLEVTLLEFAQQLQAAKGYRTLALAWRDILLAGASRAGQLWRYAQKRKNPDATFRPYAPLKVSAKERGNVKRAAAAEGVATVKDNFPWRCKHWEQGNRCMNPIHTDAVPHRF